VQLRIHFGQLPLLSTIDFATHSVGSRGKSPIGGYKKSLYAGFRYNSLDLAYQVRHEHDSLQKKSIIVTTRMEMNSFIRKLQSQHRQDLVIYRQAHQEWRNRVLHWILIPAECWSALLLGLLILPFSSIIIPFVGIGLAFLSLVLATNPTIGAATFLFHGFAVWTSLEIVASRELWEALVICLSVWTIAWALQVGVGHWIWEGNDPNVSNLQSSVSILAMCQSVLIAWSS
jgi:uncharacterized membrane protein YGL010W